MTIRCWSENTSQNIPFCLKTTSIIIEILTGLLKYLISSCTDLNVDSGSYSVSSLKYGLRLLLRRKSKLRPETTPALRLRDHLWLGDTNWRAGGLHKRAVRRVVEKDGAACRKGQSSGSPECAARWPVLQCSLPARPSVQLAGPKKIHVFHFATRPSSQPSV